MGEGGWKKVGNMTMSKGAQMCTAAQADTPSILVPGR